MQSDESTSGDKPMSNQASPYGSVTGVGISPSPVIHQQPVSNHAQSRHSGMKKAINFNQGHVDPTLLNAMPVVQPSGGLKVDTSIPTGPITSQVHIGANKILFHGVPGGPMTRVGTVEDTDSVCIADVASSHGSDLQVVQEE